MASSTSSWQDFLSKGVRESELEKEYRATPPANRTGVPTSTMRTSVVPSDEWIVRVYTGDDVRGSTDSGIAMDVYGEHGTVSDIPLNPNGQQLTHMEPLSLTFKMSPSHVGRIYKVRVYSDTTKERTNWQLDHIVIEHQGVQGPETYMFLCQDWLTVSCPVRELPAEGSAVDTTRTTTVISYIVKVHTSDTAQHSVTSTAQVFAQLMGTQGDTGPRPLRQPINHKHRLRNGQEDHFRVDAVSLGTVKEVRVGFGNGRALLGAAAGTRAHGEGQKWKLEKVVVFDPSGPSETVFPSGTWLGTGHPNGLPEVTLHAQDVSNTKNIRITLRTGRDMDVSGIIGPLYPTIIVRGVRNGGSVSTPALVLKPPQNRPSFGPGREDVFEFVAEPMDEVNAITVAFDGETPLGAPWVIENVSVALDNRSYAFRCGNAAMGTAKGARKSRTFPLARSDSGASKSREQRTRTAMPKNLPRRGGGMVTHTGLWMSQTDAYRTRTNAGTTKASGGRQRVDCWNRDYQPRRPPKAQKSSTQSPAAFVEAEYKVRLERRDRTVPFGMTTSMQPDGKRHVDSVDPTGLAAGKVHKGDVVLQMNGVEAKVLTSDSVAALLAKELTLSMTIQRVRAHTAHTMATMSMSSLIHKADEESTGSRASFSSTFRSEADSDKAKARAKRRKDMQRLKDVLLTGGRGARVISRDGLEAKLKLVGKVGRATLCECMRDDMKRTADHIKATRMQGGDSVGAGKHGHSRMLQRLWDELERLLEDRAQKVEGKTFDEIRTELSEAQKAKEMADAVRTAALEAKMDADLKLRSAQALRATTASAQRADVDNGDLSDALHTATVNVSDCEAIRAQATECLAEANATARVREQRLSELASQMRSVRDAQKHLRSVSDHSASLTPWRGGVARENLDHPTTMAVTRVLEDVVLEEADVTRKQGSGLSELGLAQRNHQRETQRRQQLAETILRLVGVHKNVLLERKHLLRLLTDAGRPCTEGELDAVLARELDAECRAQERRAERNRQAFESWNKTKRSQPRQTTSHRSMRVRSESDVTRRNDVHYCPVPIAGGERGQYVAYAGAGGDDGMADSGGRPIPTVSQQKWLFGGRLAADRAGSTTWTY